MSRIILESRLFSAQRHRIDGPGHSQLRLASAVFYEVNVYSTLQSAATSGTRKTSFWIRNWS